MKRPPQLWVLSISILCLSQLPSTCNAVRATSLIFAKTSSTTSTTDTPTDEEVATISSSEGNSSNDANQTVTKPPLTGIPQIDYIWDPNLPFELKGYNLSDYPFYDRVPEEIDFKCDGLHDGFYASVPHKCQVYHHCLFGTRYDFLCANFTAFDQKTFICHFVSEVDCNNSKKFWHRNDALYQAASTTPPSTTTTTAIPFTPSPALNPALRRPPTALSAGGARRRRPFRRRRPQYEYYYDDVEDYADEVRDRGRDYYDDPLPRNSNRRRNKRPRPNRRPEYDEYEEYEDDRYDRRNTGRRDEERDRDRERERDRRPPYDRRDDDRRYDDRRTSNGNKNKDRRVDDEDDRRSTVDRKPLDERRRPDVDYERRPYERPRKPLREHYDDDDREDDRRSIYDRPKKTEEDVKNERRPYDRPRKQEEDDRRYRPKDPKLPVDDKEDRRPVTRKPVDDSSDSRRWRPKETKIEERFRPTEETKQLIKPNSGSSVYDRPRAPPIIRRPVPKTERDKYDYKPTTTVGKNSGSKVQDDEEYYDDYEEEVKLPPPKPTRKSNLESRESEERKYSRPQRPVLPSNRNKPAEDSETENVRRPLLPKLPSSSRSRDQDRSREQQRTRVETVIKKRPVEEVEEYIDDYEDDKSVSSKQQENTSRDRDRSKLKEPSVRIETTSKESTSKEREPVVKIVKRPFLPSRGGNPFAARGLQPVGSKALDITTDKPEKLIKSEEQVDNNPPRLLDNIKPIKPFVRLNSQENDQIVTKPTFSEEDEEKLSKQSSQEDETSSKSNKSQEEINQSDVVDKSKQQQQSDEYYDDEDEFKPVTSRPKGNFNLPRTTQKPKVSDNYRNPLDINENEYDVTLNDALNPTLPNLPVRNVPTGFSNGRDGYIAQNYQQRPRLINVENNPVISSASSDYVYQVKQPQNTQVQSLRYNPYVTVQQLNYRHSPASTGQYYTTYQ